MADASPKTQITDHGKPTKFFLYKAAMVTLFLILLPLFPSVAPDFMNQTLHARSWELLQLIFVGIAVSYGLFSKKNEESDIDNPHSYMSKLLQVSSVFDDESDNHTVIEETNKMEALNSQYYRGEPVVVVAQAKENSSVQERNGVVSHMINQKPLLLPVRSLKQASPSPGLDDDSGGISSEARSSRFSSSNGSRKERNGEDDVVLRSPIPWRSRSGRMEMVEDGDKLSASPSQKPRSSSSRANAASPRVSSDGVRKKSFAPPPPAPPPPPPLPFLEKSSSGIGRKPSSEKVLRRSVRSLPEKGIEKESDSFVDKRVKQEEEEEEEEKEFRRDKPAAAAAEEEERSEVEEGSSSNGGDVGPDVDKKADEFIAKFREQIRLQRIESIRRSTAQRTGKSLRHSSTQLRAVVVRSFSPGSSRNFCPSI